LIYQALSLKNLPVGFDEETVLTFYVPGGFYSPLERGAPKGRGVSKLRGVGTPPQGRGVSSIP